MITEININDFKKDIDNYFKKCEKDNEHILIQGKDTDFALITIERFNTMIENAMCFGNKLLRKE